MSSNKQQTGLEWYHQQIVDRQNGNGDSRSLDEIFQQAKEMEKEQRMSDFTMGITNANRMEATKDAEQWYNETYGGK
jgi:hypothetical protein